MRVALFISVQAVDEHVLLRSRRIGRPLQQPSLRVELVCSFERQAAGVGEAHRVPLRSFPSSVPFGKKRTTSEDEESKRPPQTRTSPLDCNPIAVTPPTSLSETMPPVPKLESRLPVRIETRERGLLDVARRVFGEATRNDFTVGLNERNENAVRLSAEILELDRAVTPERRVETSVGRSGGSVRRGSRPMRFRRRGACRPARREVIGGVQVQRDAAAAAEAAIQLTVAKQANHLRRAAGAGVSEDDDAFIGSSQSRNRFGVQRNNRRTAAAERRIERTRAAGVAIDDRGGHRGRNVGPAAPRCSRRMR